MEPANLAKRQKRIADRDRAIKLNNCPNCNVKLRDKWHGGMYCPKCNWDKTV